MASKANPAMIGGFVLGAIALAVAGLVVLGGGKFLQSREYWEAYFGESIKGLAIGAPVTFRGVRVGSVTDIKVVVNREAEAKGIRTGLIRTPVFFEISADRISDVSGKTIRFEKDSKVMDVLFERGLRAQLQVQSLVTGQLVINLDFNPGAPMRLAGNPLKYPEFPTIPSTMAALGQSLDDLDVGQLAQDIRRTVAGVESLVNSPEVKKALVTAVAALEGVDKLAADADAKVNTLGPALERTSVALNETLETIRTLAQDVNGQTVPAATETLKDIRQLAQRIDAETMPAANQLLEQVRHLAEQFETTSEAGRLAMEKVQSLAGTLDTAVQDRDPLLYQLKVTLQEVSGAARALRVLADYLDRHPEALLFGKGGK